MVRKHGPRFGLCSVCRVRRHDKQVEVFGGVGPRHGRLAGRLIVHVGGTPGRGAGRELE